MHSFLILIATRLVILMSKYEPLRQYLSSIKDNKIVLSFVEIEKILGFELPKSARKHEAWWDNHRSHTQAKNSWLVAGWKVKYLKRNTKFCHVKGNTVILEPQCLLDVFLNPIIEPRAHIYYGISKVNE